ncbi:MAG: hypothetical protein WBB67_01630 [bacterium]
MNRILLGIAVGLMLWFVGAIVYESLHINPAEATSAVDIYVPILYSLVVSLTVGFVTAIIAGKKGIVIAVIPVFLAFVFIASMLLIFSTAEQPWFEHGLYLGILCGIGMLFAGLGGWIARLLKITLPRK